MVNTGEQDTAFGPINTHSQRILAALVRAPATPLASLAKQELEEFPEMEVQVALQAARQIIDVLKAGSSKRKPTGENEEPLLTRLRASWMILRRAESGIKLEGKKLQRSLTSEHLSKPFQNLLKKGSPAGELLVRAVCEVLDIGPSGDFLAAYSAFLNGKNEAFLAHTDQIDRVLWWLVRGVRVRYIHERTVQAELTYLVPQIRQQFVARTKRQTEDVPDLDARIGRQINRWLSYSCLSGPNLPADEVEQKQIVRAFFTCNEMKELLPDKSAERLAELEQCCATLTEENKLLRAERMLPPSPPVDIGEISRLQDEAAYLREQLACWPNLQAELSRLREELANRKENEEQPAWVATEMRELRALLILIDEKYPLDTLQTITQGAESGFTLKQFVSHLLYGLRKRGFGPYPDVAQFELSYDDSGLYDCVGFEIAPNAKMRVVVQHKGWAFRHGKSVIPVRRARVRPV